MTVLKKPKAVKCSDHRTHIQQRQKRGYLEVLKGKMTMYLEVGLDSEEGKELQMQLGCRK